jgi:DNA-binding transcriptional regulator LsrR (DeoR family)
MIKSMYGTVVQRATQEEGRMAYSTNPDDYPDKQELYKVARLHFVDGMPQQVISDDLNIKPRARVNAMCQAAEAAGMVHRVVLPPPGVDERIQSHQLTLDDLSRRVRERFNLRDCRLVNDRRDMLESLTVRDAGLGEVIVSLMAKKAAQAVIDYFQEIENPGLAVTYGYMTRKVADALPPLTRPTGKGYVVAMQGVRSLEFDRFDANDIVRDIARHFGCEYACMPVPAFVNTDKEDLAAIDRLDLVREIRERLDHANMALLAVGTLHQRRNAAGAKNLLWPTEQEIEEIKKLGGVGNIGGLWFDAQGEPVTFPPGKQVFGLQLEDIRRRARSKDPVILVGGVEPARLPALAVALNPASPLCNVWIGDEASAKALLGLWRLDEAVYRSLSEAERAALDGLIK